MKPPSAFLVALSLAVSIAPAQGEPPQPAPVPPREVEKLVIQLGDPDFKVREEASRRLKEIGKPALPALKAVVDDADPEVRLRATTLVRRLERRFPGGPLDRAIGTRRTVRIESDGLTNTVVVSEADRTFAITEGTDGIEVKVTAVEGGEQVTETYTARDATDLNEQEPEAFKVYQRFGQRGVNRVLGGGLNQGVIRANNIIIQNGIVQVEDGLDVLRNELADRMRQAKVPVDQQAKVAAHLATIQALMDGALGALDDDNTKALFKESDALRQRLADLKLPEPGDVLPPPPNQRLGIYATTRIDPQTGETTGLLVNRVIPDSRALRIGLLENDMVQKVNDKPVRSTRDIRDTLAQAKGPVTVEVVRDGKAVTLTEKPEEKPAKK